MNKEEIRKKFNEMSVDEQLNSFSLCPYCHCMTYTIDGICGKCGLDK